MRGRDASGMATWDVPAGDVYIYKQAETSSTFIKNLKEEFIMGPTIIHCRAKTRGEPSNFENNHPLYGPKYCMVHNGMVHSMKNLEGYTYKGECDTEVLLSYIETYGIREAIPMIDGSASIALIDPKEKMFYLYRHTSPLVCTWFPGKAFVFSSLEYPLKKVSDILGIEKIYGIFTPHSTAEFDEGTLFSISLETGDVNVETIKIESTSLKNKYGV